MQQVTLDTPPPITVEKRVVRILLECILVVIVAIHNIVSKFVFLSFVQWKDQIDVQILHLELGVFNLPDMCFFGDIFQTYKTQDINNGDYKEFDLKRIVVLFTKEHC